MAKRIIEIDGLARRDHYYLEPDDKCFFYGEYTAGEGHAYSETNQLILNFKKPVDRRGKPEWRYKERAIAEAAQVFRSAFKPEAFKTLTFVPIPPSKAKTDPLYDDRLYRMLQLMCAGQAADIRELVLQSKTSGASHNSVSRPAPDQLAAGYHIDKSLLDPKPSTIAIFDDLLTTGSHFKAVQSVLLAQFPKVQIVGFFIARRVPKSVDFDFDVLDTDL